MIRLFATIAVAFGLAACEPARSTDDDDQWQAVNVEVVPVPAPVETVGRLAYRGGIEIRSTNPMFVGLSGIEVLEDGRVVAISDEADWIEAHLALDARGFLTGFTDVRAAFMRDEHGRVLTTKAEADSEGLAQMPDGRFAVSFERTHLIRIYDLNRDGPFGAAQMGPRLAGTEQLPANASFEALAAMDGALVTAAEGGEAATTPMWVASLGMRTPVPAHFSYPLSDGFSITGMDRLPDGDFVAIERFYAPVIGPRARITRFAAPSGDGGVVHPEVLAVLDPPFPLDNFEGISAVRMSSGTTRIYIVSDNNKNARQRTLLLAFDLIETPAAD
ncbi:MAG: esterase-like activity of phytase family protein [Alphaproteobacteria bacterium]|nr:esterase-like activity of phytase family protein [Alphaproteobacteria bacterium]